MASFSSSSSSTLVSSIENSHGNWKKTIKHPTPCLYDKSWTKREADLCFRGVRIDPMPTLYMVQMIVDAYEERRHVWEFNKELPDASIIKPAIYGPIHGAQKKVKEYLMDWRFLSTPPPEDVVVTIAPAAHRHPSKNKVAKAGLSAEILGALRKFLRIKDKPLIPRNLKVRRPRMVLPAFNPRPASPSISRIVPEFDSKHFQQRTLRRMTRADSHQLRIHSIRKRKYTPAPKYEPTPEFLAKLRPLRPSHSLPCKERRIQHDSTERALSWLKSEHGEPEQEPSIAEKQNLLLKRAHMPIYISLIIYLLIQVAIVVSLFFVCFVALLTWLAASITSCYNYLPFVADHPMGYSENSLEETLGI
ncbi:hypothetical protein C0991_006872 [Blastosporella zonata]|nr:hypothetical protein C0991_006872 [Blastosporella zonata]